jgi:hypothetical protein
VIERDPRAIDLTQTGGTAGNFGHQSGLTETHFPKTLGETVVAIDLTNPTGRTGCELAKWK